LGVWSEGINILKHGVTVADFQNVDMPQNGTRFGLPEKKKADIRKMMPEARSKSTFSSNVNGNSTA
jgi:hypothetical protein